MKAFLLLGVLSFGSFAFAKVGSEKVSVQVTDKGFSPSSIQVKAGTLVTLEITRTTDATCSTSVQIPSLKIKKDLPLNQKVSVDLGFLAKGTIKFGCGMDMMDGGTIIVN
jgi:plastocyanin domain-containing protein